MSELNLLTRHFLLQAVRTCSSQQDAIFLQQMQQAITQARRAQVTRQLLHGVEADSLTLRPIPASDSDSAEDHAFSSSGASSSGFVPLFVMPASIDFHRYWQCRLSLSIVSGVSANLDPLYKESTTAPDASNMPNAVIDQHFQHTSSLVPSSRHSLALHEDIFREVNFDERESNCEYHHAVITVIPFSTVQHAHAVHTASSPSAPSSANPFDPASLPPYLLGGRPGRLLLTYASNRLFAEEEVERLLLRVECPEYVQIDPATGEEQILPAIYVTLSSYKRFVLSDRKPKSTHRLNHLHQFLKTVRIPSALFFHFLTTLIQAKEMSLSKTAERHLQEMRVQYEFTYEGGPAPNLKTMGSSSRRKADSSSSENESDQSDQPHRKQQKSQKKRNIKKGASRFIDDEAEEESDEDEDESGSHEDEEGEDVEDEDDEEEHDSELDGFVVDDEDELIMDSSAEPSEESDASARKRRKGKQRKNNAQKPESKASSNATNGKRSSKVSQADDEHHEHKSNVRERDDTPMEDAAAVEDAHMSAGDDEDDDGPAPSPSSNRKRKRILDDEDEDEHHTEAEDKSTAKGKSPKLGAMKSPKLTPASASSSPALKPHGAEKKGQKEDASKKQAEPTHREKSPIVKSESAPANKKAKLSASTPQPPARTNSESSATSSSSSDSSSSDAAPAPTFVTVKSEPKKPISSPAPHPAVKIGKPISSPVVAPPAAAAKNAPKPIQAPGRITTPAMISKPASPALRAAAVVSSAENRAKLSGLFDEDADFAPKPVAATSTASARPKRHFVSSSDESSSDSDSDSNSDKSIDMTKPQQQNKGNFPAKFQPPQKHKNKNMK